MLARRLCVDAMQQGNNDTARSVVTDLVQEHENTRDDGYVNYGDVTAHRHGGIWSTFDTDEWHVVKTTHPHTWQSDYPEDTRGHQLVETATVYIEDVVADDGMWTSAYAHIPVVVHQGHRNPIGAAVDADLTRYVAHECRKDVENHGEIVKLDTYDAVLDAFGVTPA